MGFGINFNAQPARAAINSANIQFNAPVPQAPTPVSSLFSNENIARAGEIVAIAAFAGAFFLLGRRAIAETRKFLSPQINRAKPFARIQSALNDLKIRIAKTDGGFIATSQSNGGQSTGGYTLGI